MCSIVVICGEKDPCHMMMSNMKNRGPDDTGMFLAQDVSLGRVWPSILDPACGGQPMSNEWPGTRSSFNGEVYDMSHYGSSDAHHLASRTLH